MYNTRLGSFEGAADYLAPVQDRLRYFFHPTKRKRRIIKCSISRLVYFSSSTRIKFLIVHPFWVAIRLMLAMAIIIRTIQKICTNVKFIAEDTTWNEFVVILKFPLFINPTFSPIFNDVKTTPLCQEKGWGELKKLLLGHWRRAWRDHRFIFTRTFPLLEFRCYFFYQLGIFKQIYHGHTQCL